MANAFTDKFSEAMKAAKSRVRPDYERAVRDCDEAWDGVEGAMSSRLYALAREAHAEFRVAYAKKIALWQRVLNEAA
jgi:hypothetical protein